jgi:signal transduction histidine kinase
MDAFLSYSSVNKNLARRLREELASEGLSVWWDESDAPVETRHRRIEEAIRSSDYIVVLIGPRDGDDEAQVFTWRVALETVWRDSSKRLVPILLRGAELPPFVRSGTSGKVRAIQVENPRKVQSIAQAVLDLIHGRASRGTEAVRTREFQRDDDRRREALSAMASYVEHNLRTPPPKRGDGSDG